MAALSPFLSFICYDVKARPSFLLDGLSFPIRRGGSDKN